MNQSLESTFYIFENGEYLHFQARLCDSIMVIGLNELEIGGDHRLNQIILFSRDLQLIEFVDEESSKSIKLNFFLHSSDHGFGTKSHFEISKADRADFWINRKTERYNEALEEKGIQARIEANVVFFKHGNCPAFKLFSDAYKSLKNNNEALFFEKLKLLFHIFDDQKRDDIRERIIHCILEKDEIDTDLKALIAQYYV